MKIEKDVEARISDYIRRLLVSSKEGGDRSGYNDFLSRLRPLADNEESPEILIMLKVLSSNVSYIDERSHEALLQQVLGVNLWLCTASINQLVHTFALNLVSGSAGCLTACLEMLVKSLVPQLAHLDRPGVLERKQEVHAGVVDTLRRILVLAPTASSVLLPLLLRQFPHKRLDARMHCTFLEAAFALAEAREGEQIREQILLGVVDILLQVDVDIRWEDIMALQEEDEEEQAVLAKLRHKKATEGSDSDGEDDDLFQLDELNLEGGEGQAPKRARGPVDETADKLDSMMDLTFRHLQRREQAGELSAVFASLMRSFDHSLLHVHRSKFTQFLLFYVCAKDFTGQSGIRFLDRLMECLAEPSHPTSTRIAAAAYLASFLSRARFLTPSTIMQYIGRLAKVCHGLLGQLGSACTPAAGRSGVGAVAGALLQALLYVLCYRLRQLVGNPAAAAEGATAGGNAGTGGGGAAIAKAMGMLELRAMFAHPLQPHLQCLPSVVTEFLSHAVEYNLMDEVQVTELQNGLSMQPTNQGMALNGAGAGKALDSFFPFDPYLLRRSALHLSMEQNYIRWGAPQTLASDDDGCDPTPHDQDDEEEAEAESSEASSDDEEDDDQEVSFRLSGSQTPGTTPIGQSMASVDADDMWAMGGYGVSGMLPGHGHLKPSDYFAKPRPIGARCGSSHMGGRGSMGVAGSSGGESYQNSMDSLGTTPLSSTPMSCTPDLLSFGVRPPFPLGKR